MRFLAGGAVSGLCLSVFPAAGVADAVLMNLFATSETVSAIRPAPLPGSCKSLILMHISHIARINYLAEKEKEKKTEGGEERKKRVNKNRKVQTSLVN